MDNSEIEVNVELNFDKGGIGEKIGDKILTSSVSMETAEKIQELVLEDIFESNKSKEKYTVQAIEGPNIVHLTIDALEGDSE